MIFLANENVPLKSIHMLKEAGYDVAAIIEDSPGIRDEEVLNRAANEKRIILTPKICNYRFRRSCEAQGVKL